MARVLIAGCGYLGAALGARLAADGHEVFGLLVDRVRRGEATIPPRAVYANRIHRDDCVGTLRHLMAAESPKRLYLAGDHEPAEIGQLIRWLAGELGVLPRSADAAQSDRPRYGRTGNKRVQNARLLASGYRFRYPTFREGYGQLTREKGREGNEAHG